jgi:hypothetical protein
LGSLQWERVKNRTLTYQYIVFFSRIMRRIFDKKRRFEVLKHVLGAGRRLVMKRCIQMQKGRCPEGAEAACGRVLLLLSDAEARKHFPHVRSGCIEH